MPHHHRHHDPQPTDPGPVLFNPFRLPILIGLFFSCITQAALGQELRFTSIQSRTNRDIVLTLNAPVGLGYRIDTSSNLVTWSPMLSLVGTANDQVTDTSAGFLGGRYYRVAPLAAGQPFTGDHFPTSRGGDAVVRPINHASFLISWNGHAIYNDPVGAASLYAAFPKPTLVLVSHSHSDHFSASTLTSIQDSNTVIIAPAAVYASLSAALKLKTIPLSNGSRTNVGDIHVEAVPAYNGNHPKGTGNGYVLTLGGRRLYMSGDTEDIPEMRALTGIDVAFLCMNLPFTMSVDRAASAVRAFRPKVVYPYHYRNQDNSFANLELFRRTVGTDVEVEVRTRKWY